MTDTNQTPEVAPETAKHTEIKAQFNNKVDVTDVSFSFRTVKDEVTKEESKRPTVTLPIPSPSVEGIIHILQNGDTNPNALALLLEAVSDVVKAQARDIINDNEAITTDNFPYSNLAWDFIANMPKAERRGGGIPKELWEAFVADYIDVMPAIANKTKESCELAGKLIATKYASIKNSKVYLRKMTELIGLYTVQAPKAAEFADCIEFLDKKANRFLSMSDEELLKSL